MKRKSIILVLIAVLLLIGLAIYFRPLHFSVPDESSQIAIVLNEYAVRDGKPTIDSAEYPVTSPEQRRAIRALLDQIEKLGVHPEEQTMFICHADCEAEANGVAEQIRQRFGTKTIHVHFIGPVIGSHTGPDTIGIFFVGTER